MGTFMSVLLQFPPVFPHVTMSTYSVFVALASESLLFVLLGPILVVVFIAALINVCRGSFGLRVRLIFVFELEYIFVRL